MKHGGIYSKPGQDHSFHLSRIMGLNNVWSSPVNFMTYGQNGTAMNLFYPWLTIYPAAIFTKISGSLIWGYNLYYLFLTFVTMLICFYTMLKLKNDRLIAFLFAIVYTFSAYRATDVFYRGAMGEAVSLTLFPIVFLGTYYVLFNDYKKWYWLTIGMTLLVYTHLLSVIMCSIYIGLLSIHMLFKRENIAERIKALILATTTTLVLSLAFFIPFLEQITYVKLKIPKTGDLQERALSIGEVLSKGALNDYTYYGLGLIILVLAIISLIYLKKFKNNEKYIFWLGCISLIISTKLFPWSLLQNTPLNIVQFPWRWIAFATLFYAISGSIAFIEMPIFKMNKFLKVFLLFVLVSCTYLISLRTVINFEGNQVFNKANVQQKLINYRHSDYANEQAIVNMDSVGKHEFIVNNKPQQLNYTAQASTFSFSYENHENSNAKMAIPIYFYKGQIVKVNGKQVNSELSKWGTTEITLEKGVSNVVVAYKYTLFSRLSQIISFVAFIIFCHYLLKHAKKNVG